MSENSIHSILFIFDQREAIKFDFRDLIHYSERI